MRRLTQAELFLWQAARAFRREPTAEHKAEFYRAFNTVFDVKEHPDKKRTTPSGLVRRRGMAAHLVNKRHEADIVARKPSLVVRNSSGRKSTSKGNLRKIANAFPKRRRR